MDNSESFLQDMFKQHNAALMRFLKRKLSNHEDALEVAQDAYQKMLGHEEPEKLENARAYLFQIASNIAIDRLRRGQLHNKYLQSEASEGDGLWRISPERTAMAQQDLDKVLSLIDQLPPKCRQAFLLHRGQHLSYEEIARELKVSVSMVEKYIIQALKHCRKGLQ